MSKRVIALVASLAVVIGLMASGSSYAWFSTTTSKKQKISVGLVSSVHSAYLADIEAPYHTVIMQGDNLVSLDGNPAMLQLENKSTTDTQFRISIEYTSYHTGKAQTKNYSAAEDDDITVEFAPEKWAKGISGSGTCYFYYMGDQYNGKTVTSVDSVPAVSSETKTIPAISSIYYNNDVSSVYSGKPVNVKVIFESKQADNVTWSAIDSYNVDGINK